MNKIQYPFKQAIITGLCAGIFAIASYAIADGLNRHFAWGINPTNIRGICGLLTLIILGTGIYTSMQTAKRNSGALTYGQAVTIGVLVGIITGIITAFFGFIYCAYINPGNTAYMVEESQKAMIAEGVSPTEIAKQTDAMQKQLSTGAQVMQALVGQPVCGTIIALIMGIFVRSKKVSS